MLGYEAVIVVVVAEEAIVGVQEAEERGLVADVHCHAVRAGEAELQTILYGICDLDNPT